MTICLVNELFLLTVSNLQAEENLTAAQPDKEYLPITGLPEFTKNAAKLAYSSESKPFVENRACDLALRN